MASRFTYSVQTSGFNKTVIVYDSSKIIYTSRASSTAPIDGPNSLVSEAKLFLIDQYGPDINNMVRINAANQSSPVPNTADNKKQIDDIKDQQQSKKENLEKSLDDKQNFLKEQNNVKPTDAKKAIIGVVLPILTKFISFEKSANAIINKIVNDTRKKLKDKGRIEVSGASITFTPKNAGDYQRFKQDFDRKVNNLKNTVKTLKTIVDSLNTFLKVLKTALVAFKVLLSLKKKQLQVQAVAASADLSSPSPVKPAAATYTISDRVNQDVSKDLEKKIDDYILLIGVINSILKIFQKLINSIKAKLETLNLTILATGTNTSFAELSQIITENPVDATESDYSDGEKQYTIKVVTTPSGALQAVAYDKFSMLKITQTAPSRTRKADELITELKQILG